jgi:transcriptional regulator with XRE-family HTH domain
VPEPADLLVGLGLALRQLRTERRMSQEELSLRTGVHRNFIGGIERAERSPSVVSIVRLASALDVQLSELFRIAEAAMEVRPGD